MSKTLTGYSVRVTDDENVLSAVTPLEPGLWAVDELVQARGATLPPEALIQVLARNSAGLTWLMPNDLAEPTLLKLPPLKGKELARAVTGTIDRQEKTEPGETFLSWQALASDSDAGGDPASQVFVLHARQEDIDGQMDHHLARTMRPQRLLPGYMVLDQFFRFTRCDPLEDNTWTLVYLGKQENFLVVGNHGSVILTRPLPFDLNEDAPGDQYIERLATEVERSGFFVKQGELGQGMDRTLVAGDPELAPALVKNLNERSGVPAEFWDISRSFQWGEGPVPSSAYIPLMAAAMARRPSEYNLLPATKRKLFGPQARRRAMVAAGTLGTSLLPVLIIGSAVTARVQESYLQNAQARLEEARGEAARAAEAYKQQRLLKNREELLNRFHLEQPDLEGILVQVGTMAPREILLHNLKINQDDLGKTRLTIVGQSEARRSSEAQAAFIRFQKALDSAPFLEKYTEPLQLEISGDDLKDQENPRTLFKMKYILAAATAEEG